MPESLENHIYDVTIVYSRKENKVHCLKGSLYYNANFRDSQDPDLGAITITSQDFFYLFRQNPKVAEWNVEDVRTREIKKEAEKTS